MPIIIDGYNLMHAAGLMQPRFGPHGLEKARGALLGILAGSLGDQASETTVVFDAKVRPEIDVPAERELKVHGMRVLFAVDDPDADALIEKLVQSAPTPKQLTVVSGDRRLRAAAKRRGSQSLDSESFWQELMTRRSRRPKRGQAKPEKPAGHRAGNSEFWMQQFEGLISDEELRELAGLFSEE